MVDHTRRRRYQHDRVLIESDRIITPQFDDAVIYLSGAQLEMLRNVSQYLRNLSTYVSEYQPGYYLTPDASDYDDILEIVADLEETLMGNPNTIWGYKTKYIHRESEYGSGTNDVWVAHGTVPAGELWVMQQMYVLHESDSACQLQIYIAGDSEYYYLIDLPAASPNLLHPWAGTLILAEDDEVVARVVAPGDGKLVQFGAQGYMMDVPPL